MTVPYHFLELPVKAAGLPFLKAGEHHCVTVLFQPESHSPWIISLFPEVEYTSTALVQISSAAGADPCYQPHIDYLQIFALSEFDIFYVDNLIF